MVETNLLCRGRNIAAIKTSFRRAKGNPELA
jgi:hypothetical protein